MSNWEARELTVRQVHYGALDALLCGHVFRGLRLWHASPSACPSCRKMLGVMRDQVRRGRSGRSEPAHCAACCHNRQDCLPS